MVNIVIECVVCLQTNTLAEENQCSQRSPKPAGPAEQHCQCWQASRHRPYQCLCLPLPPRLMWFNGLLTAVTPGHHTSPGSHLLPAILRAERATVQLGGWDRRQRYLRKTPVGGKRSHSRVKTNMLRDDVNSVWLWDLTQGL